MMQTPTETEPVTMYLARIWGTFGIAPIEVCRLTAASYWEVGRPTSRNARATSYYEIYATFEEAKARVVEVGIKEVQKYESRVANAKERLAAARSL